MHTFTTLLTIGSGGFAGALLRYSLSDLVRRGFPPHVAFVGTLAVNLTGCLLIGAFTVFSERQFLLSGVVWRCLIIGVLGSLTTFSTFAMESLALLQAGRPGTALLQIVSSVVLGVGLVWTGMQLAQLALPTHSA